MSVKELAAALCRLPSERDAELECRFNRNSSLADGLLDRWIWAPYLGVDEGAKICDGALTLGDVKVVANTWTGPYTPLDGIDGGNTARYGCSLAVGWAACESEFWCPADRSAAVGLR